MFTLNHSSGRTAIINGIEHLFFSGYSYLGMSHVPEFISLVKDGLDKHGLLHPSSRISNTRLSIFEEIEAMLSHLTSQEETVIYSSGFLAGRAVVELIENKAATFYIVPSTHPALQSKHATVLNADWQKHLHQLVKQSDAKEFVVLFDSVNPLTATINDLSFFQNLPTNKKITCVVDDSHGIGLLSDNGEGISGMLHNLSNVEYILTYSLSKAFHINGGAVSCSSKTASFLRQSPFYTASTSIAPALCYAFINAQEIYNNQRKKLRENIRILQKELSNNQETYNHSQLPIIVLDTKLSQDYFTPHNIIISSFSYPDPAGQKINRVVLNALHTGEDLKNLIEVLVKSR